MPQLNSEGIRFDGALEKHIGARSIVLVPRHRVAAYSVNGIRTRALDAAVAILNEHGTNGLSLRAIAERAHFGIASIYHYFPSKEALLLSLAINGFDRLRAEVMAADRTLDNRYPIVRAGAAYFDFVANNSALFALMYDAQRMAAHGALRTADQDLFVAFKSCVAKDPRVPLERCSSVAATLWALGRGIAAIASSQADGRLSPEQNDSIWGGAWYLNLVLE
jgi:AcrR family transcriptional regulator